MCVIIKRSVCVLCLPHYWNDPAYRQWMANLQRILSMETCTQWKFRLVQIQRMLFYWELTYNSKYLNENDNSDTLASQVTFSMEVWLWTRRTIHTLFCTKILPTALLSQLLSQYKRKILVAITRPIILFTLCAYPGLLCVSFRFVKYHLMSPLCSKCFTLDFPVVKKHVYFLKNMKQCTLFCVSHFICLTTKSLQFWEGSWVFPVSFNSTKCYRLSSDYFPMHNVLSAIPLLWTLWLCYWKIPTWWRSHLLQHHCRIWW